MSDAEKLIVGIITAIVLLVVGFFVVRAIFPKKVGVTTTVTTQATPTATPSLPLPSATPTAKPTNGSSSRSFPTTTKGGLPLTNDSTPPTTTTTGSTGSQVIQSQGDSNSSGSQSQNGSNQPQGSQSQSQNGSHQSQTQTLPNGTTQSQNQ